jgi:HAD superfamily hydrolase (TIGR01549 family)
MEPMKYDAVVFDNDGVLVGRTNYDVLEAATWDTFDKLGIDDPKESHVDVVTVGATPAQVQDVAYVYDVDPCKFWRVREETVAEAQHDEVRAGRKSLYDDLDELHDLDLPMGIVSSNQQSTVDFVLDHHDVRHHFETAYGREPTLDSLARLKPDPHYVEHALSDIGADTALFVGDNESDIRVANNAGIDSAFIRRPHREDWYLNVDPTHDIDSLTDLHDICV